MGAIFDFMNLKEKKEEFRGAGFIALGKISKQVPEELLERYLQKIFWLVDDEIVKPVLVPDKKEWYLRPIPNTDVLICIRDLAKKYGIEFERRYCGSARQSSYAPNPK